MRKSTRAAKAWPRKTVRTLLRKKVLEIGDGYRARNSELGTPGLPFARAGNINEGFHFESADCLAEANLPLASHKLSQPGDVLFTSKGTFGRFAYVREDTPRFVYSPQLCYWRVRDPEVLDSRFLYYWMQSDACMNQLRQVKGLTDMADYVSLRSQKAMWVHLPPLDVQQRIAGVLSTFDDLIENSRRRLELLEELARGLYREWLLQFRFPGHETVSLRETAHGPLPEGWEWRRLGDLAEEMRRNVPKGALAEPRPYVGLGHLPRGSLSLREWDVVSELGSNKLEFRQGEVLFGKIRPYFHKVSIAPCDGLCSADTIVLRARQPEDRALVTACVSSAEFVARATASANGSKMPRANWSVLAEYAVAYPDPETLRRFSAPFNTAVAQQQTLVSQVHNLRETRDLLLPRLFPAPPR